MFGDDFSLDAFEHANFSIRHFSIMNSLFTVLNSSEIDSSEYILAKYFLENFDRLSELNIFDVASACYMNRSSVRRFCDRLGFSNFQELKRSAWEVERQKKFYTSYAKHDNYKQYLAVAIADALAEINDMVSDFDLDTLVLRMQKAKQIVLVASDFSSMSVKEFQQQMITQGKVVRVCTDGSGDLALFDTLSDDDLVIVLSTSGNYAKAASDLMHRLECNKVLITMSREESVLAPYDMVFHIAKSEAHGKKTVHTKYGLNFFFDRLFNRYVMASSS